LRTYLLTKSSVRLVLGKDRERRFMLVSPLSIRIGRQRNLTTEKTMKGIDQPSSSGLYPRLYTRPNLELSKSMLAVRVVKERLGIRLGSVRD
jgi:hypothetical protein